MARAGLGPFSESGGSHRGSEQGIVPKLRSSRHPPAVTGRTDRGPDSGWGQESGGQWKDLWVDSEGKANKIS